MEFCDYYKKWLIDKGHDVNILLFDRINMSDLPVFMVFYIDSEMQICSHNETRNNIENLRRDMRNKALKHILE